MKLQLNLRILFALAVALALFLIVVPAAQADGVIVIDDPTIVPYPPVPPRPTPWPPRPPIPPPSMYLPVKYHRVTVTIEDQVATTKIDQVFLNEYDRDLEGTYPFPLPEEATISRFVMGADGQPLEGRVLSRDEARRIYEDIVGRRRDPALLERVIARSCEIKAEVVGADERELLGQQAELFCYPERFDQVPLVERDG